MQQNTLKKRKKNPYCIHIFSGGKEKKIPSTAKLVKKGTTKIFHSDCLTPGSLWCDAVVNTNFGASCFSLSCVTIFQWFFLQWCNMQVWRRLCYPEIRLLMFWLRILSDILWCCFYVELYSGCTQTCSSVISSTKSHGSWSHIAEITCTLGKSLCSWGCQVDSCRNQGTPCSRGHAILWYKISLCAALYTPSVKLATLSDPPWRNCDAAQPAV